jgi:PAS domain S-box-containing protein
MADVIRRREELGAVEGMAERPDGSRIPFLAHPTPLFDDDGVLLGAINLLADISDQKAAQRALSRRMNKLATLYRFTDRLHRVKSFEDIYEAALDAITSALRCQRASVLVFDASGTMKFVAWRSLSDAYRAAVEGHSPWSETTTDAAPIAISDVLNSDLPADLKATVLGEDIRALAFIPLLVDGQLVGKFMAYFDDVRVFEGTELELALTLGRQLGSAVQRMRAEIARASADIAMRASEQRLNFALEAGRMGAWEWNIATGQVTWSPGLERIHGLRGAFGGTFEDFKADIHPDDLDRVTAAIQTTLETLEPYAVAYRIRRPDGAICWLQATGGVSLGPSGEPERLTGVCMDVTERKSREEQVQLLMHEVNHRSKNMLSLVQAVARQTSFSDPKDFLQRFSSRVSALAASQDLLVQSAWRGVDMRQLVASQLAHFQDLIGNRIHVEGPEVRLASSAAQNLGMALHELGTNAGKYGALSDGRGEVHVAWSLRSEGASQRLRMRWVERGGPHVSLPPRRGFGSTVIETMVRRGLDADVTLEFAPAGIDWQIDCPAEKVLEPPH